MIELLEQFSIDLIVVAANSLEAIKLKRSLEEIAAELKTVILLLMTMTKGLKKVNLAHVRKLSLFGVLQKYQSFFQCLTTANGS